VVLIDIGAPIRRRASRSDYRCYTSGRIVIDPAVQPYWKRLRIRQLIDDRRAGLKSDAVSYTNGCQNLQKCLSATLAQIIRQLSALRLRAPKFRARRRLALRVDLPRNCVNNQTARLGAYVPPAGQNKFLATSIYFDFHYCVSMTRTNGILTSTPGTHTRNRSPVTELAGKVPE